MRPVINIIVIPKLKRVAYFGSFDQLKNVKSDVTEY